MGKAAPLLNNKIRLVAISDLDNAANVFKSSNGAAATSLAASSKTFGAVAKGFGVVGAAYSSYGESLYIQEVSIKSPNKVNMAVASSVVNISGDTVTTVAGAKAGAVAGAYFVPVAYITVPLGAVIGGLGGHYLYDTNVKEFVRESYVGRLPK